MGLKHEVLRLLEENRESYLSGQEIANRLAFSRTAVWKAIHSLKEEGYQIHAVSNKGYQLDTSCDLLSSEGIHAYLAEDLKQFPIYVYQQIGSTNTEAKQQALNGAPHGTIILAEEQTQGRGRLGRKFYSPKGTGIYMSIILRPQLHLNQAIQVTTTVAVAVCRVIEKLTNQNPHIKWVNDIYLGKQKICGILTEAVTDFESGQVEFIILGIGLNVNTVDFPADLHEIAGSLNPKDVTRNQLCAHLLNELFSLFSKLNDPQVLEEYKSKSNVLGNWITFMKNQESYEAFAEDINEQGGLIVRLKNDEKMILNSGEISIRWTKI
ncbi:biotin--[acetyl-CoA-carboxylase] ligase [Turicibacter bilis]|uniref:biotin--[acetyl-CoA-carboxylase] ligase n=1 Tax=Turicibacter bilis TaxID=2735723 RepID=UPI0026FE0577|nr:biotin--[acetyl-CoA-carboxylase] ligase [Turicibacter sp.]